MSTRLTLATALLLVASVLARAHAGEPGNAADKAIAVLAVQISGDAPPELRAQVQESIRIGLAAAGYTLVFREQVMDKTADAPELADCTSTTCLQRIGAAVGANQFLRAQVEATGAAYAIRLELLAPEVNSPLKRRVDDKCSVCTITELSEMVSGAARQLVTAQSRPVTIVVVTRPQGANLQIDARDVGPSPYQGELSPGSHTISALLPGHLEAEQTITVAGTEDGPARFEIILTVVASAPPPAAKKPRFHVWKWVTAGGALTGIATGIALIALDGDASCSTAAAECPERYATMAPGIAGVILGVGLGAAGGWMFVDDRKTRRKISGAALVPIRGGAIGAVGFSF